MARPGVGRVPDSREFEITRRCRLVFPLSNQGWRPFRRCALRGLSSWSRPAGEGSRLGCFAPNASSARFLAQFTLNGQGEIPRCARNDKAGEFFSIMLGGSHHDPQLPQRDTRRDYHCGTLRIRCLQSLFSHLAGPSARELFFRSPRGSRPTPTHVDLRGRRYALAGSWQEDVRQR